VKARPLVPAGVGGACRKAGDLGYQRVEISSPPQAGPGARGRRHRLLAVWWDRPGVGAVLFIAIVALIVVGFIEFLARGAIAETTEETTSV
jgi:hypothetical protein